MANRASTAAPTTGLRGALAACRGLIGWTILFSAGVNLLYLAPSLYMMQVYDRVLNTGGLVTLGLLSVVLVFALAILAFLDLTRNRIAARLSLRLDRLVGPAVVSLGMSRRGSDATRAQAVRDFDTFRTAFTSPAAIALMDTPWTLVFVGVCFLIHPLIGLATLVGGIVLFLIALRHERAMRPVIAETAAIAPKYYASQEHDRAANEPIRALGMRGVLLERQLEKRRELLEVQTKATFVQGGYGSLSRFWRLVLQSAVLGLGAYLAIERQISPGSLIAGSILASRALGPLEQVVAGWRNIEQGRVAYRSLVQMIDEAPPEVQRTSLPAPRGQLSFEEVGIRLTPESKPVLNRVSFQVQPGEVFAVIGPSGAGKSALARAAVGAIAPTIGSVRLDGSSLSDWDQDQLGAHIGYLPQEVSLLAGTVGENIRRFAPSSDDADRKTIDAARAAGVHDMIQRLQNGYDTMLGPGGRGLSLGQSQRVALARALYGNPSLLILDEPNAHVDGDGELALIQSIKNAAQRGASVVLVAHKPTMLAIASRVLILRDGGIEALGPREEIARRFMRSVDNNGAAALRPREIQQ